jgi:hydroxymethylbilane synthase
VAATFLAMAGLQRLGLLDAVTAPLAPEEMLPAVAQGAIGIECRDVDPVVLPLLARIDHAATMVQIRAERAFLAALDGSCRTPIAALAELEGDELRLRGLVASPDGRRVERIEGRGPAPAAETLGAELGAALLARVGPAFYGA